MNKLMFRILVYFCIGLIIMFIAFGIYTVVVNWMDFFSWAFLSRLLTLFFYSFVLSIPLWIHAVSIRHWQVLKKKVSIVLMVIVSASVTIYGFLRPQAGTSSLSWIGFIALMLYFVASVISAYFNWPRPQQQSKKMISGSSTRKSTRKKNRVYISVPLMMGTDDGASVVFLDATFQKVGELKKRYPDPDFGTWLIEQIYSEKKIMAERRGAFKKKLFCTSCGAELPPEIREPNQIEYELTYKDFDPFVLRITIPSVVCPQCGKISGMDLDGSLNNHLNEAIIAAFKAENIKP